MSDIEYKLNTEGEQGHLIMQDLDLPAVHATPEAIAKYEAAGRKRIHWVAAANMGTPFQINTSWYYEANHEYMDKLAAEEGESTPIGKPHVHEVDELLCFYGSDPYDPYSLGGEVEIWLNGEPHLLTKSSLLYIPAGMPHLPLYVNKVARPIFHFSMLLAKNYSFKASNGTTFSA